MSKPAHLHLIGGIDADTAGPADRHDRRASRQAVLLVGTISHLGGRGRVAIKIRNISTLGMMCDCAFAVQAGDRIEIELARVGLLGGTVRWCTGGRIGIEFDGPIKLEQALRPATTSQVLMHVEAGDGRRPGFRSTH
jgi:hypothetical protein